MNVTIEERIRRLEEYRDAAKKWKASKSLTEREQLRELIARNRPSVKREVLEAGCYKTVTVGPPPAVGGLVMNHICVFDMMFNPPYLQNFVLHVVDMINETIGVMETDEFQAKEREAIVPASASSVVVGYVFIAMPIDPADHGLEDVLDAVKEGCSRCGLNAERVDESHSNDRITDRILESIRRAEYVVVDLTNSRPNVFYEAGYAQGIGKTPIYIARSGTALEFDLKDYPVIFFESMKQLKEGLEARLRGLAKARA